MTKFFYYKYSNCDLDPTSTNLEREEVQVIVIPNITVTVILYQVRLINESAGAMAKGEHVCCVKGRGHNSAIMI